MPFPPEPLDTTVPPPAAPEAEPDPLSVRCLDCLAPAGTPCRTNTDAEVHATRTRTAQLRALEQGTCSLCGRFMVRGSIDGAPVDAWHPDEADHGCPVMPNPQTDWDAYAAQINLGYRPGHPGLEHFQPAVGAQA